MKIPKELIKYKKGITNEIQEMYFIKYKTIDATMCFNDDTFCIFEIENTEPHNGVFAEFMKLIENLCKQYQRRFAVLLVTNQALKKHLLKNGFREERLYLKGFDGGVHSMVFTPF